MPEMLRFGERYWVAVPRPQGCDTIDWRSSIGGWRAPFISRSCAATARRTAAPGRLSPLLEGGLLRPVDADGEASATTGNGAGVSKEALLGSAEVGTNEAGQTLTPVRRPSSRERRKACSHGGSRASMCRTSPRGTRRRFGSPARSLSASSTASRPRTCASSRVIPHPERQALPLHRGNGDEREPARAARPPSGGDGRDQEQGRDLRDVGRERQHDWLWFDGEMLQYRGRRARVLRRIEKIIDEKTAWMLAIRKDTVILDGVICTATTIARARERSIRTGARAWLRRVESPKRRRPVRAASPSCWRSALPARRQG